ncbi:MAG: hypothetical protein ACM3SQ_05770 [Betaproteobacteria bacterium]
MTISRCTALLPFLLLLTVPVHAQSQPTPAKASAAPPLRRWLEIESFTVFSRYRFTDDSRDVTTANQLQYKDQIQARVNLDAARRYSVHVGFFSGGSFIGTWNNWGVGHGTSFDGRDNYVKQLYASAAPIDGMELQYGGLYLNRGEADEWVTYDTDGYIAGERVSVRRPKDLYLDEITITRAALGPFDTPSLFRRWDGLAHPNYTQVLARKRFSRLLGGSLEYDRQLGADLLRAAITVHLPATSPVSAVRWEQYRRFNRHAASGVGVWAERSITKHLQLQAGYVTVDRFYGGWNADRMQSGRHLFAAATIPIHGPFTASIYAARALSTPYAVPIGRRFDAVIGYDVRDALRRTGIF